MKASPFWLLEMSTEEVGSVYIVVDSRKIYSGRAEAEAEHLRMFEEWRAQQKEEQR